MFGVEIEKYVQSQPFLLGEDKDGRKENTPKRTVQFPSLRLHRAIGTFSNTRYT
jgi:hypothetical protein